MTGVALSRIRTRNGTLARFEIGYLLAAVAAFAAGVEIVTESGSVQTAVPLVMSSRCMVILRVPRSTLTCK